MDAIGGTSVSLIEDSRNPTMTIRFDAGSQRVIGASWGGSASIWNATSPHRKWSSPSIGDKCGRFTSLVPDDRFLAIGCGDHLSRIWDTTREQLLAELPGVIPARGDFMSAHPAVSIAGDRAAIARGESVELYELPSGKLLRTISHRASVNTVAFAGKGHDLVSGAVDGSLLVTRENGAQLVLPVAGSGIDVAGFLPSGDLIAADAQRRLRFYNQSGSVVADFKLAARVKALRISPDGRRLITLSMFVAGASPELWDVEHFRAIRKLDAPGQGHVVFCALRRRRKDCKRVR